MFNSFKVSNFFVWSLSLTFLFVHEMTSCACPGLGTDTAGQQEFAAPAQHPVCPDQRHALDRSTEAQVAGAVALPSIEDLAKRLLALEGKNQAHEQMLQQLAVSLQKQEGLLARRGGIFQHALKEHNKQIQTQQDGGAELARQVDALSMRVDLLATAIQLMTSDFEQYKSACKRVTGGHEKLLKELVIREHAADQVKR
jgi:hypothetical protein